MEFECVSRGEVERAAEAVPGHRSAAASSTRRTSPRAPSTPGRLAQGVRVTVDNAYVLASWPKLFRAAISSCASTPASAAATTITCAPPASTPSSACRCRELDAWWPGSRRPPARASSDCRRTSAAACSMSPTGSRPRACWRARPAFRGSCSVIDVGGGLGVPERAGPGRVRSGASSMRCCSAVRAEHPQLAFWLEPGRYLVATAGVLLARVTQLKSKGERALTWASPPA